MKLKCFHCGKPVTTILPEDTIFRATATCPECAQKENLKKTTISRFDCGHLRIPPASCPACAENSQANILDDFFKIIKTKFQHLTRVNDLLKHQIQTILDKSMTDLTAADLMELKFILDQIESLEKEKQC